MFKNKRLIIALLGLMVGGNILGYYATSVKDELILIDDFVKAFRYEQTEQSQKLVKYLEKVLKNDCGKYGTPEYRHISEDEVLAIHRVLISGVSFEDKRAGLFNIMLEVFEKDAQIKEEQRKENMHATIMAGCTFAAYVLGCYSFMKYVPEIDKMLLELQKSPGWFRKATLVKS